MQTCTKFGILSADLYKIYVNPLLDRLNHTGLGAKIGNIICNTSACADDITLNSSNEMEAQVLIDTAAEYAKQERYQLQHTKTNSIRMHSNRKQYSSGQQNLNSLQINGQPINDTKEAPHIGLLQSDTIAKTMEINVEQNIKKARRTTYSLMASGLHGHNAGADPGFQGRGAHLKKLHRAKGGMNIFGVFHVKNHDFTQKNYIFFQFFFGGGGAPPGSAPAMG